VRSINRRSSFILSSIMDISDLLNPGPDGEDPDYEPPTEDDSEDAEFFDPEQEDYDELDDGGHESDQSSESP
jgi:hypothetical protein